MRDLVYLVRSGDNDELKHSLRSVEKHATGLFRKVWVVGVGLPDWLANVEILPIPDGPLKHQTMRDKVRAVCDEVGVSDEFILMNDDYFLTEPITEWVVYHSGPASEWLFQKSKAAMGLTSYLRDVKATCEWMSQQGFGDILIRETHSPTVWDKQKFAKVLDNFPPVKQLTVVELYEAAGAVGGVGECALNAKVHNDEQLDRKLEADDSPWLSSSDFSFENSKVGNLIRGMFPEKSRFEV